MLVPFDVSVHRSHGVSTISAQGEIDLHSAGRLERVLEASLGEQSFALVVVLDLTGVTFCDSTGLRALFMANRLAALNDVSLTIVVPEGRIMGLLEVSGLADMLPVTSARPYSGPETIKVPA